ncbi:carbohydrate ABC transporter permease [Pararhizobium sp.]|uniref:carbohydrate ABC transporter permease n=1 Tax=Pararhizobium sp. TaxID=1977563 RepID=UPI00271C97DD|nr:carbohydrate ABC transporter permease [Pararhizobium sp.]MDO9415061.1 carbohydrate ABC transporter permease [Pararhizobium sp.]
MINDRLTARLRTAGIYLFLIVASLLSIFPFAWMVMGMTNTSTDIAQGKFGFGNALSANVTTFFTVVDGPLAFWNTAKIALVSTFLTLLICSVAGYGFEMFRSKIRERIFNALLLTMMIPAAALLIPLFIMVARAGFINTHTAVIAPSVASAFMIFYFRQSAKAFPPELRQAAKVDGLKEWQIFLFIFVPVMRSTYAAAFIMAFMAAWNAFLWPLVVLQSQNQKTITLVVSSLAGVERPDYGVIMVGATLATLPILLVFFAMQKQFVQGMLGSVK